MRPIGVIIGLVLVAAVLVIVVLTTVLVPEELNPAFDVALAFTDAVLEARDDAAAALIGPEAGRVGRRPLRRRPQRVRVRLLP